MWTHFWDMHSGGGTKVWRAPDGSFFEGGRFTDDDKGTPFNHIYIEAPEDEAVVIFYNRFGHNPHRVTCTCCGADYSIDSEESLARLTGFHRNCASLETPRDERGLYKQPDDPWFKEHYYLEPHEYAEAEARGYKIDARFASLRSRPHMTVDEYLKQDDVLVIRAADIADSERQGDVPEQGFVWV